MRVYRGRFDTDTPRKFHTYEKGCHCQGKASEKQSYIQFWKIYDCIIFTSVISSNNHESCVLQIKNPTNILTIFRPHGNS